MRTYLRSLVAVLVLLAGSSGRADDSYYIVPLNTLKLTEGELPVRKESDRSWRNSWRGEVMRPYAILDVSGEAYVNYTPWSLEDREQTRLCVRVKGSSDGKDLTGRLYVPKVDRSGMVILKFTIPASAANRDGREQFFMAKLASYQRSLDDGGPGTAWFRHQMRKTRLESGEKDPNTIVQSRRVNEIFDEYDLFTGGRALSENMQLDRVLLPVDGGSKATVDLASIPGITVQEIDWTKLTKDLHPTLDPLSKRIPADQHVVFFPTFEALIRVTDEAELHGTPVLRLAEPRAEDARTVARYQKQLCLSLSGLGRRLGPVLARSVALTGSDLNYRTGTDLAILFESPQADLLQTLLLTQVKAVSAAHKQAEAVRGTVGGLKYEGARSPDRKISCYIAKLDDTVVVTNSLYQLERLASVHGGKSPALSSLPEFTFFRNRYHLGDKEEAALVFLSDATIRRWCGPRWRIAGARQIRDLAILTELEATYLDQIVNQKVQPGPIHTDMTMASAGQLTLSTDGVSSSTVGTLEFLTPIAEIPLSEVTKGEAVAYERWRQGYQSNWSWAFDPVALRLTVQGEKLAADLSVMPLIWATQYRDSISISQGAEIKPGAGDPHSALAHYVMSLNRKSSHVRQAGNLFAGMARGNGPALDPLGWIGQSFAVYADDDPVWEKLAKIDPEKWEESAPHITKIPVALWVEVSSPLKATLFLAGVRAFIEQTAPGMTRWESLTHKEKPYVKITASDLGRDAAGPLKDLAIYYSISSDALIVSLNEQVIQRATEREQQRRQHKNAAPADAKPPHKWLGSNVAFEADRKLLEFLTPIMGREYQQAMQTLAWRNIPVLNEWMRLYPDRDPAEVHEQAWKIRPICPGGGKYVWNDAWQTMESTVYGHPGVPKNGPAAPPALASLLKGAFGLTFEDQGLRARAVLERKIPAEGIVGGH